MKWDRLFRYDAETGILYRKERPREDFKTDGHYATWLKRFAGKPTGCNGANKDGSPKCVLVGIGNRLEKAHRIIWEMNYGPIPKGMVIDHIDRNPWNNRLDNLRVCEQGMNAINKGVQSNNSTGVPGVHFEAFTGKYRAAISIHGKDHKLGRFASFEEAVSARLSAQKKLHGEYAPR